MYDVWKNALAEIEQQISTANFSTWFQDTSLLSTEDGNIKIGVKNSFYVKQLRNRYLDLIKTALENNNITVSTIDFEVQSSTKPKVRSREITPDNTPLKTHVKKANTSFFGVGILFLNFTKIFRKSNDKSLKTWYNINIKSLFLREF